MFLEDQKKKKTRELREYADSLDNYEGINMLEVYRVVLDGATKIASCKDVNSVEDAFIEHYAKISAFKVANSKDKYVEALKKEADRLLAEENVDADTLCAILAAGSIAIQECEEENKLITLYIECSTNMERTKISYQIREHISMVKNFVNEAGLDAVISQELINDAIDRIMSCTTVEAMARVVETTKERCKYMKLSLQEMKEYTKNRLLDLSKDAMTIDNYKALMVALEGSFDVIDKAKDRYEIELFEQDMILLIHEYRDVMPEKKKR